MSIPTYSFLPYLRQGIANSIQSTLGARGNFTVKLDIHGDAAVTPLSDKQVDIYGPGDIIGIDSRAIVKTDPHPRVTNFEANYLPYIDFYDEDFPWRYTPVPASNERLDPWITLIVLAKDEFEEGQDSNLPLPFFKLKSAATRDNFFPKKNQLWAWAHVHINGDLTKSDSTIIADQPSDVDAALNKLQQALDKNSDTAYSRIVCLRKLKPSTDYVAFVIPSYESGRLAGLGNDAATINAAGIKIAWEEADLQFPYYYRWEFSTATIGDFEYLVRLLKPKVADSRVGRRVMDMTHPGGNLHWVEDSDAPLGGILRLGGALKVPAEALTDQEIAKTKKFDQWATRKLPQFHPFEQQVAGLLNLADDYNIEASKQANADVQSNSDLLIDPNEDEDPLITPPIYGKWHAIVERVYKDRNGEAIDNDYNWINELNLDPRFRVPAHFGTRVVQKNQEDYMQAAWEQVGEVLSANRQIRFGQFSISASTALYSKHFSAAASSDASKWMLLTAPLQKRMMFDQATVFHQVRQSVLPNTMLSAAMRRVVRPGGKTMTLLTANLTATPASPLRLEQLVAKVSTGELPPSPLKQEPAGLPTVDELAGELKSNTVPDRISNLLKQYPWLPIALLILAGIIVLLLLITAAGAAQWAFGVVIAGASVWAWKKLNDYKKLEGQVAVLNPEGQTPMAVFQLPKSDNFKLLVPGEVSNSNTGSATDSTASIAFKQSLQDMFRLHELVKAGIPKPMKPVQLNFQSIATTVMEQLKPEKTIPAWVWQSVLIPDWLRQLQVDEGFVEAMTYPKINKPMYDDLKKISDELFLPNVNLIDHNSITLLETNQPFIESYMVGLNHEFARELLWREYPTDQRGSYFRQFWDVSSVFKDPALTHKPEAEQREPYYDITKLHEWRRKSKLGGHDNRQKPGEPAKEEVVLVIRGELLKKYPTAVIYAHKADWTRDKNNQIDITEPRSLYRKEEGDVAKPNPDIVKTPMYSAKVDPDIYFFGFDLTVPQAKGEKTPETPTLNNAGWFFVIKERPGEPRFGFDITATDGSSQELVTWNDLDWAKVVPAEEGVVDVLNLPHPLSLPASHVFGDDDEGKGQSEQFTDDKNVSWNENIDAANLAYILYQVPMMVCVHASEMLLQKKS